MGNDLSGKVLAIHEAGHAVIAWWRKSRRCRAARPCPHARSRIADESRQRDACRAGAPPSLTLSYGFSIFGPVPPGPAGGIIWYGCSPCGPSACSAWKQEAYAGSPPACLTLLDDSLAVWDRRMPTFGKAAASCNMCPEATGSHDTEGCRVDVCDHGGSFARQNADGDRLLARYEACSRNTCRWHNPQSTSGPRRSRVIQLATNTPTVVGRSSAFAASPKVSLLIPGRLVNSEHDKVRRPVLGPRAATPARKALAASATIVAHVDLT
jgi:hypothetical protein